MSSGVGIASESGQSNQPECVGPFNTNQHIDNDLNSNTKYTYQAYGNANCTQEVGIAAQAQTAQQVTLPPYAAPPQPPKLWTKRVCDHHFGLQWERAAGATGYDLEVRRGGNPNWKRKFTNKNYSGWQAWH